MCSSGIMGSWVFILPYSLYLKVFLSKHALSILKDTHIVSWHVQLRSMNIRHSTTIHHQHVLGELN